MTLMKRMGADFIFLSAKAEADVDGFFNPKGRKVGTKGTEFFEVDGVVIGTLMKRVC